MTVKGPSRKAEHQKQGGGENLDIRLQAYRAETLSVLDVVAEIAGCRDCRDCRGKSALGFT